MTDSNVQTLKTFLICPCGAKAAWGYAFPGQRERGVCDMHKASVEMSRELSPGRAEVASVRKLDEDGAPVATPAELAPVDRDLNWTRGQLDEAKETISRLNEELAEAKEMLAEWRQEHASQVDGHPQT